MCYDPTMEVWRQRSHVQHLSVVLLGEEWTGRSSAGNTILGRSEFPVDTTLEPLMVGSGVVEGRNVTVVNTPGWDPECPPDIPLRILRRGCGCASWDTGQGPHALLLTVPIYADLEWNEKITKRLLKLFDENTWRHTILLFTRADLLGSLSLEEYLRGDGLPLQALAEKCERRFHCLNNQNLQNRMQVRELLEKIDQMVAENGGKTFQWIKSKEEPMGENQTDVHSNNLKLERLKKMFLLEQLAAWTLEDGMVRKEDCPSEQNNSYDLFLQNEAKWRVDMQDASLEYISAGSEENEALNNFCSEDTEPGIQEHEVQEEKVTTADMNFSNSKMKSWVDRTFSKSSSELREEERLEETGQKGEMREYAWFEEDQTFEEQSLGIQPEVPDLNTLRFDPEYNDKKDSDLEDIDTSEDNTPERPVDELDLEQAADQTECCGCAVMDSNSGTLVQETHGDTAAQGDKQTGKDKKKLNKLLLSPKMDGTQTLNVNHQRGAGPYYSRKGDDGGIRLSSRKEDDEGISQNSRKDGDEGIPQKQNSRETDKEGIPLPSRKGDDEGIPSRKEDDEGISQNSIKENDVGIPQKENSREEDNEGIPSRKGDDEGIPSRKGDDEGIYQNSGKVTDEGSPQNSGKENIEGITLLIRKENDEGITLPSRKENDEGIPLPSRKENDEGIPLPSRKENDEGIPLPSGKENDEGIPLPSGKENDEGIPLPSGKENDEGIPLAIRKEEDEGIPLPSDMENDEGIPSNDGRKDGSKLGNKRRAQDEKNEEQQTHKDGAEQRNVRPKKDRAPEQSSQTIRNLTGAEDIEEEAPGERWRDTPVKRASATRKVIRQAGVQKYEEGTVGRGRGFGGARRTLRNQGLERTVPLSTLRRKHVRNSQRRRSSLERFFEFRSGVQKYEEGTVGRGRAFGGARRTLRNQGLERTVPLSSPRKKNVRSSQRRRSSLERFFEFRSGVQKYEEGTVGRGRGFGGARRTLRNQGLERTVPLSSFIEKNVRSSQRRRSSLERFFEFRCLRKDDTGDERQEEGVPEKRTSRSLDRLYDLHGREKDIDECKVRKREDRRERRLNRNLDKLISFGRST